MLCAKIKEERGAETKNRLFIDEIEAKAQACTGTGQN
jgi:hypothetical protein